LPRTSAPQIAEPAVPASLQPITGGRSILLADDDRSVREVTAQMLRNFGFTVTETDSGMQTLQLLAEGIEVDLLLADYAMPGMSGGELARSVRALYPEMQVSIVTGYAATHAHELAGF